MNSRYSWSMLLLATVLIVGSPVWGQGSKPLRLAPGETGTIRLVAASGPLDNPLKGWCPYTDAGPIHQPYSMVFKYISWRELEPTPGDYRFDEWEATWDQGLGRDRHVIFRVYIDYPSKPSGLPQWVRDLGVEERPYEVYGGGRTPDYNDPRLLAGVERLIAKLGERYDTHPRVAFIQLGLLGFWGEWHTYPHTEWAPSSDTERKVIAAYRRAFPNKVVMARYARDNAGEQAWLGFHDDMFPEDTDNGQDWAFLAEIRRAGRSENWKVAVVGGELVPGQAERWLGAEYLLTKQMLERSHFSWVGPYGPPLLASQQDAYVQRSEELVRRMGYEFQLTRVVLSRAKPQQLQVQVSLKNQGVAPFYYRWPAQCALLDSAGNIAWVGTTEWDVRQWLPGEHVVAAKWPLDLKPGIYRVALGIQDPWTKRLAIRFANDAPVLNGWTVVATVEWQGE